MKIYIAHSKKIPYQKELYEPIINSSFYHNHTFIFPHIEKDKNKNSREFYKTLDIVFAEVSDVAIGLGIELGWAFDDNIPIFCFYKKGAQISYSLQSVTSTFIEYEKESEMIQYMENILHNLGQ